MAGSVLYSPLIQWKPALQGLLAGSLIAGGLLAPVGWGAQAVLFVMGVFIFIDSLIPNGQTSMMATVAFAILGAIISILSVALGFSPYWVSLVVGVAILFYFVKLSRKRKRQ